MKRHHLIIPILLFFAVELYGQNTSQFNIKDAYQQDVKIRKTGMLILGSWAAVNMIAGGIGRSQLNGEKAYFHEMNLIWNVVNLGIAGAGYYFTLSGEMLSNSAELLESQVSFQKILLFNAGLDIAYVIGGFYLMERSKNTSKNPERLKGYGKSVILQGGFLLLFDLILHGIHSNKTAQIPEFLSNLYITPQEFGLVLNF